MCNPQQLKQQQQQQKQEQSSSATASEAATATATASATNLPASPPSPSSAYVLYLHREEIRRRKTHSARASMTKIQLTSELIARTKQNISRCSYEDLEILARETLFKKNLQRHLHYRRMQMQAWMAAKKQGKIAKVTTA
ncbi:uncharacterized protein LOC132789011 [Drosophila nasuta]|uniref:uncharacterized protein LOC132789011 n=1 Tax=Drosophila nasuta TaxID=42062 RepID=UPI00295F1808|nr:uncharacterized protein LOC132789011 [Drosophila nasuta]